MKICFWGTIMEAVKGRTIGGGELQIALIAKALASAGHDVVVIDPGAAEPYVSPEGVKVINVPGWNSGLRGLRAITHRIPALYKLMVKQKADFYYVRMRIYMHLIPYLAAKKVKGKFVVGLASDIDTMSLRDKYKYEYKANFNLFRYLTIWLPNDIMFKYLVKRADFVLRQHSGQEIRWKKLKGKAVIFPNIIDSRDFPYIENPARDYFIYVGSVTMMKGAESLCSILKSHSSPLPLIVVGQPNDVSATPVFNEMKKIGNGAVRGRMNHDETMKLIANAKALINTSKFEGFPNVFLEAWAMGVPVLSLRVNPGNIFNQYDLGTCFDNDLEKMKQAMMAGITHGEQREKLVSFIREHHDFSTAAARFEKICTTTN